MVRFDVKDVEINFYDVNLKNNIDQIKRKYTIQL